MYTAYWRLNELPFENTPNPKFFYASEKHHEALSRFEYLVREKKACGVMTGVYGCGKTLVLYSLMKAVEPEGNRFSIVTNPRLDDLGILRLILDGFKKSDVPAGKADVLMELKRYIEGVASDGKHSVIVVDEAHAIENEKVFEELRLLLNFQTESRSLVTLLLVGQPELTPRVESNKQLNQRVNLRFHLDAFTFEDMKAYIDHRMKVAGGDGQVFTNKALEVIHKQSGGIPRWINHFCNMSLLTGYSKGAKNISPEIVEEAIQGLAGAT